MVRQALSDHSGHDQTQEPRCFTLYLVLLKGLYVVVLNSGPQAPELYRFLFQPGPGWRAQNCWLDFSFYCCCCCCCCSLRNSLCCRQTFFVSFSCWGLVLLARLVGPPSAAISETDRFWDSLVGWDCTSCVWTSAPAWALGLHKVGGSSA